MLNRDRIISINGQNPTTATPSVANKLIVTNPPQPTLVRTPTFGNPQNLAATAGPGKILNLKGINSPAPTGILLKNQIQ